jgi:DNA replication protein DnaC
MPNIPRAILFIDDTQLLQSLLNELEKRLVDSYNDSKALNVFYPHSASISSIPLPENEDFDEVTDEQRKTMEQALGSDITYIWGPPGTGKTFVIAHLIMAYVMMGQRVLVTSHTNTAVDQILLAMFKYSGNHKKPAFNKQFSQEESIIRIGIVPEKNNMPDHVKLDKVVEKKSVSLQHKIDNLQLASKEFS